jgi:asparagine synthase (glutamine-hydrolysing)
VGVFGRGAGEASPDVRAALDSDTRALASESMALAWTGVEPVSTRRLVLVAGRLHNLPSLAAELGAPESDTEHMVSLAFDRWGEAALTKLRGSFVLVVWDAAADSGLLAVDQLGVGGLFVRESPGKLSFATEVRDLLRVLPRRPAPERAAVVQWVADGRLRRGETLYEGVRRVEGGTFVRLERGRAQTETYWTPRYVSPARLGRAEAAAELRSSLARSVRACVAEDGPVGVQVSGGLDSSIVAALARELEPPVRDLTAYSLVHPDHADIDESRLIDQVTSTLGLASERLPMRGASALSAALEFQLAWEVPTTTPMLAFNLPLLRRAAGDGVAVMLDGEGGDELLGCSEYLLADRVRRGDLRGAVSLARRLPGVGDDPGARFLWALVREFGIKGAMPHRLHRALRRAHGAKRYAPRWLTAPAAAAYVELRDAWSWKERNGPRWWSYHAELLTAAREHMGAFDLLRRRAALCRITNTHPLLDDLDLVELVLRLPPELALDPVLTRPLARDAVAGLLPDAVRLRPDKVDFSGLLIDALGGPDAALLRDLLGPTVGEIWAYVDQAQVHQLLDVPIERRSTEWARVVSRLATTECWLRSQGDPTLPQRLLETR